MQFFSGFQFCLQRSCTAAGWTHIHCLSGFYLLFFVYTFTKAINKLVLFCFFLVKFEEMSLTNITKLYHEEEIRQAPWAFPGQRALRGPRGGVQALGTRSSQQLLKFCDDFDYYVLFFYSSRRDFNLRQLRLRGFFIRKKKSHFGFFLSFSNKKKCFFGFHVVCFSSIETINQGYF